MVLTCRRLFSYRESQPVALYQPTIPMRYSAMLLAYLRELQPQAVAQALLAAGIAEGCFDEPEASLTISQFAALLDETSRLSGRPDIGFELGRRITLSEHGLLGHLLPGCANLDEVLRLVVRFYRLITPSFFLQYRRQAAHGELVFVPAAGMSTETLQSFNEINAVSCHLQLTALTQGQLQAYDIYMPMDPPSHVLRYRELAPARFHFGLQPLPQVRIVIPAKQLDQPLAQVEQQDRGAIKAQLSELQLGVGKASSCSEWVVLMLREADGCQPTLEELAALLSLSPRTLTRYLAAEGYNFRQLACQIRWQRACTLLRDGALPIAQIAYRLGYNDQANFSNAFRQACGVSPRAYRSGTDA